VIGHESWTRRGNPGARLSSTTKGSGGSASQSRKTASPEPGSAKRACEEQFGRWLAHGFTGCKFAPTFVKGNLLFAVFDQLAEPQEIDAAFDLGAGERMPTIALFPRIRTEDGLVQQLHRLAEGKRWRVSPQAPKGLTTDDFLVGIEWTTSTGLTSMPMGFAPLCTMPVTRRAPYVALGTWPGAHANPHTHRRPPSPQVVDFLDAALPLPLSREEFDALWVRSTKDTTDLLGEVLDKASNYRSVAFRLSKEAKSRYSTGGSSTRRSGRP